MLSAILLSAAFQGYSGPDDHHFRYQGRLNSSAIEQIYRVNSYQDPSVGNIRRLRAQRLAALAKVKEAAESTRRAARARLVTEARRRAAAPPPKVPVGNLILPGIISLKRLPETGPIDGCQKVNKGLIMGGGFMLFTCEKLLPEQPISQHSAVFKRYNSALMNDGWRKLPGATSKDVKYKRSDGFGCEANLNLKLWTDRSMNQPQRPASDRNAHRQIVFMAKFYGSSCERYYPLVEKLAAGG